MTPAALSAQEIARFFASTLRPSCACTIREIRQERGQYHCVLCGAVLVPVAPKERSR